MEAPPTTISTEAVQPEFLLPAPSISEVPPPSPGRANNKSGIDVTLPKIKEPCCPSNRKNICVGADGTLGEFGLKNSNVIEFISRILKDEKQLTYYISGIGTYGSLWFRRVIDSAIATSFQRNVLKAYEWLCNHYEPGDRIFLFGFSRGAYQVRVIAGMIERVGLLYKGNNSQLPSVLDLYMKTMKKAETGSVRSTVSEAPVKDGHQADEGSGQPKLSEAERRCKIFKEAFSQPNVKVHFVGAWDTVSSVGIARGPCWPETVTGMTHVCHFRQALALDERRVRFWPEHASGSMSSKSPQTLGGDVKEVWFAGSHSDIGGGSTMNEELRSFGPALRWMTYEAMEHGLRMRPYVGEWLTFDPETSLKGLWYILELLPILRPSYKHGLSRKPHLGTPRRIQKGQYIHQSVMDLIKPIGSRAQDQSFDDNLNDVNRRSTSDLYSNTSHDPMMSDSQPPPASEQNKAVPYRPVASFADATTWEDVPDGHIVTDPFASAISAVEKVQKALNKDRQALVASIEALRVHVSSHTRRESLAEVTSVLKVLFDVLEKEYKEIKQAPSHPESTIPVIFSTLAYIPPQLGKKWPIFKFRDLCPPDGPSKRAYRDVVRRHGDGHLDKVSLNLHHATTITSIIFSPNADSIFCGSSLEVATWSCQRKVTTGLISLDAAARFTSISPDGSQFATVFEKSADLRDMATGKILYHLQGPAGSPFSYSPDGKYVASASKDGSIQVWNAENGKPSCAEIEGHDKDVCELAFSSDGSKLLSGYMDSTVQIWDTRDGRLMIVLEGHTGRAQAVAFSSDDTYIVSGSADTTLRVWEAETGKLRWVLKGKSGVICCAAFSPDDKLIASGCGNGTIHVWDMSSGDLLVVYDVSPHYVHDLAFSNDGKHIVSGSCCGVAHIWDANLRL